MKCTSWYTLGVILLVWMLGAPLFAQSTGGSLAGTITDPSGRVIPGATITATNVATGQTATTVSTSTGNYLLPDMALGTYTVQTAAQGFSTAQHTGVVIQVGTATSLNIVLAVGTSTTTVNVVASAPPTADV